MYPESGNHFDLPPNSICLNGNESLQFLTNTGLEHHIVKGEKGQYSESDVGREGSKEAASYIGYSFLQSIYNDF